MEKNEAIRRAMARKLANAYNTANKELMQISADLSATVNITQVRFIGMLVDTGFRKYQIIMWIAAIILQVLQTSSLIH